MAVGAQQVNAGWRRAGLATHAGPVVAAALFAIAAAAVGALLLVAGSPNTDGFAARSGYIFQVARFTLFQAGLSAFLSLAIAILIARSSWRRASSWNAYLLISLSFLPIVLPTTVAASGLIAVWGRSGILSQSLGYFGFAPLPSIYGLGAVLLAHVFFNAPLMFRVLTGALSGIPDAHWRQASQWGLGGWQRFRVIEWPAMRPVIPGLLSLVFLLCFTSFSLILMLGGGPAVTTLEVSIYTALRFEFDLPLSGLLAMLQLLICAVVVVLLAVFSSPSWAAAAKRKPAAIAQKGDVTVPAIIMDAAVIGGFLVLVALPIVTLILRGIGDDLITVLSWPIFWRAAGTSLAIGLMSGALATLVAFIMALSRTQRMAMGLSVWKLDVAVSLYLAVSAIVLGTGLFILLRGIADVFSLAPILVLLANMLVALPFAYRVLEGRLAALATAHDRLCAGLGIRGWRRLRHITLPAMAPEIGYAAGLSAALSLGDMTVIALFGSQQFQTLPWLLYQTMARYRSGEAAALALLLLVMTLMVFVLYRSLARQLAGARYA